MRSTPRFPILSLVIATKEAKYQRGYICINNSLICPTPVAQSVSARLTGHILEALLPQEELKE